MFKNDIFPCGLWNRLALLLYNKDGLKVPSISSEKIEGLGEGRLYRPQVIFVIVE